MGVREGNTGDDDLMFRSRYLRHRSDLIRRRA
jgi:hypothetical protein